MPCDIRVPIPQPSDDLRLYFDEGIKNDQFGFAFDLSVSQFDERARMTDILVTAAEGTNDGVAVRYTIRWEAFHASAGKTVAGSATRVVCGRTDGSEWVFTKATPPVDRSTLDEF